ncbi:MAG TPA: hypothetical protein VJU61_10545, partial [Polyangiaceae bacterium]|nr:hypothetical protein [Polyangiaceae bacterium]
MRAQTTIRTRCRCLLFVVAGMAGTGGLAGCSTDKAPGAEASAAAATGSVAAEGSASAQASLKLVTPTLGGNVLAVGD